MYLCLAVVCEERAITGRFADRWYSPTTFHAIAGGNLGTLSEPDRDDAPSFDPATSVSPRHDQPPFTDDSLAYHEVVLGAASQRRHNKRYSGCRGCRLGTRS